MTDDKLFSQNILENLSSLRTLNHFKKNYNKIECNIQQGKADHDKLARPIRKKRIDCLLACDSFRKSEAEIVEEKGKTFASRTSECFYKPIKPQCPSEIIKTYKVYPRYKIL